MYANINVKLGYIDQFCLKCSNGYVQKVFKNIMVEQLADPFENHTWYIVIIVVAAVVLLMIVAACCLRIKTN